MPNRILVVDDEQDIRHMVLTMLIQKGYRVDSANSASDGWEAYDQAKADGSPFDLLILDIAMPQETGLKLAQRIRDSGDHETRIVMFTGFNGAINRQQAADVGAAYLTKPVTIVELLEAVEGRVR
jgi:DNA-binding response OmpR family regulator